MDLVEIRKKAKKKKGRSTAKALVETPSIDEQVTPDQTDAEAAPPEVTPNPAEIAREEGGPSGACVEPFASLTNEPTALEGDALESLFAGQDNLSLATEESYLQALQGNVVEVDKDASRWLSFALEKEEYAVNIEQVKEIIKPREITDIPRVPDYLLGVISLRGIVVPVVDLRQRLNLGAVDFDEKTRIIVCEQQDRIAGLLVDSITQVVNIGDADVEPPPAILSGLDREMVEGVGRIQGQMIILLDLAQVLDMEMN